MTAYGEVSYQGSRHARIQNEMQQKQFQKLTTESIHLKTHRHTQSWAGATNVVTMNRPSGSDGSGHNYLNLLNRSGHKTTTKT